MPSKDSITKTIRLNADDIAIVKLLMRTKGLTWSGAIHWLINQRGTPQKEEKVIRGTPQKWVQGPLKTAEIQELLGVHPTNEKGVHPTFISDATREDIEKMCHLSGISTVYFFEEVDRLFNEGKLEVDCMRLKSNGEYDLSTLESVCHLNNVSVEDAIEKTIISMSRNRR